MGVAIAGPVAGLIADRLGRKRVIVWSAALLGVTTLCSALAVNLNWLISGGFLPGSGDAGSVRRRRSLYQRRVAPPRAGAGAGYYLSGTIAGGVSGRLAAGFIAEYFGWRWIFVAVGTVILLTAFLIQRTLPRKESSGRAALPPGGAGLAIGHAALAHLSNPRLLGNVSGRVLRVIDDAGFVHLCLVPLAAPPFSLSPGVLA